MQVHQLKYRVGDKEMRHTHQVVLKEATTIHSHRVVMELNCFNDTRYIGLVNMSFKTPMVLTWVSKEKCRSVVPWFRGSVVPQITHGFEPPQAYFWRFWATFWPNMRFPSCIWAYFWLFRTILRSPGWIWRHFSAYFGPFWIIGRHFWPSFGPFWIIWRHFWPILGPFWVIWRYFRPMF